MTTIAISIFGNRVSGRLDCTDTFLLVTVKDGIVQNRSTISLQPSGTRHMLENLGVEILICGGITERCRGMFAGSKIRVIPWTQGNTEDVLKEFISVEFSGQSMNSESIS